MADHNKPEKITPDPGLVPAERPQGAVAIGESANHESSEVQLRPIITTTIAILLIVVISDVVLYGLYKFWQARERANGRAESPLQLVQPEITDPKLQTDEPAALARHVEEDRAKVDGYGWVEPGKVASVPVESAIEAIAAKGALPTGPEWSLRPDERMVGGVILNPAQVQYANTPPSQALVGQPGAAPAPGQVGTAPTDNAPVGTPAPANAPTAAPAQTPRFGVTQPQAQPKPAAPAPATRP